MGIFTTRPVKEVSPREFLSVAKPLIAEFGSHAFDHITEQQRKVFKECELINLLQKVHARKVYLQENGRHCAYYRIKEGYQKLVISIEGSKVIVVTFMQVTELPKVEIENEKTA